jgi:hypothetical protein
MSQSKTNSGAVGGEDHFRVYDKVFENPTKRNQNEAYVTGANNAIGDTAGSSDDGLILSNVDRFLEADQDDQLPPALSDQIRNLCNSAIPIVSPSRAIYVPRRAWLDERGSQVVGSPSHRSHQNPLSAEALQRGLQQQRWEDPEEPDADRRLM